MPVPTEFQAIILCGPGHRLYPLTEPDHLPKALLPVAGKPLLSYPLGWLEKEGIYDVTVVAHKSMGAKLTHYLNRVHIGSIRIDLVLQEDEEAGTLDALLLIKDKIKTDFIVLSCDLVLEYPFQKIAEKYRLEQPTFMAVLLRSIKGAPEAKGKSLEPSWIELVALDVSESKLLMMESRTNLDDEIQFPFHLLQKYPHLKLFTDLSDAHFYMMSPFALALLIQLHQAQMSQRRKHEESLTSLKEEFIPWLISTQWKTSHLLSRTERDGSTESCPSSRDAFSKKKNNVECLSFIINTDQCPLASRVNSLSLFAEVNRQVAKTWSGPRIPASSEVSPKTQIGNDSLIGENTKIGERCSVKKSLIGSDCILGSNVKLNNCIVLDHVTIEDGVKLDNVIVCQRALLKEKSSLKDCEVGVGFVVDREMVAKGETLVDERGSGNAGGGFRCDGDSTLDMDDQINLHIGHAH